SDIDIPRQRRSRHGLGACRQESCTEGSPSDGKVASHLDRCSLARLNFHCLSCACGMDWPDPTVQPSSEQSTASPPSSQIIPPTFGYGRTSATERLEPSACAIKPSSCSGSARARLRSD